MKFFFISTLALNIIYTATCAAEAETLEQMTVTARPPGLDSLEHVAQPISLLRDEALEKAKTASIGETLSLQPGVTGTGFGPFASRPIIRGLGGSRVQVLQGGIGTLDMSTISVDHPVALESFGADQIEIFRGPSTLLYGSGASGGLVNLVTGRIPEYVPENFKAKLDSRYNTVNQEKLVSLRADGGLEDMALHFDATIRNAHDYHAADGKIRNSAYDSEDVNLGAAYHFDRGFFGFSYGRLETMHEIPLDPAEPDELPFIESEQDRIDFAAMLDSPLPGFQHLRIRAAHNNYQHIEFEGPGEPPGTTFDNAEWEGRMELQHSPLANWSGSLGTQFNLRSFAAAGDEAFIQPVKSKGFALFILEESDHGDWHFELGGRYEYKQYEPTRTSGQPEVNHNAWSVAGGTHWHFIPGYSLALSLSRSERIPSEEELFANGPHLATGTFEMGNPALEPETANNIDLSFNKKNGHLTWKLNLFLNYIQDYIFLNELDRNADGIADEVDETGTAPGELLLTGIQQEDSLFYGTEAEALYAFNSNLDFRLFGDYVRAERDGGDDLPRISPARLGGGLIYDPGHWQFDLDIIHVFGQDDLARLESGTGGYVLLNTGAVYRFSELPGSGELFLRASNLLDEDARRHTSFIKDRAPLPGRAVMLGISLEY